MGVDAVYLFDEKMHVRSVIVWDVYELIHDESTYELDAEIDAIYDAKPGEYLGFSGIDGDFLIFEIDKTDYDDARGVMTITATYAPVKELARQIVREVRLTGADAKTAAAAALDGSGWAFEYAGGESRKADLGKYFETRWKTLKEISLRWNVRVRPRYEFDGERVISKIVQITPRENVYRGRIFEGETNSSQIYVTKSGSPVTRMYGIGKPTGTEDPPTCVTFASVAWSKEKGDPADKPAGQDYIEDAEAISLYGGGREDVYSDKDIDDPSSLLSATWENLQKIKKPSVSGTATAADVEHIPGYEHHVARMYDLVWVRTKHGEDVSAVIINIKRDYLHPSRSKIYIGSETDESGLVKKVAVLSGTSKELSKSSSAQANRYIETKKLIQLNADTIQMNARMIEANAEKIALHASNLEQYMNRTDQLLTQAWLTLYGDGTSANAGLTARVSHAEGEISRAALTLYGDGTSANAGLAAKVGDHEAALILHANELGTLAEVKADKVDLGKYATVSRLEAEIADVKITESSYVTTAGLNTQSLGANFVETNTFSLGGTQVTLKSTAYVKNVERTKRYALSPANVTIEIWEISDLSEGTLYYLGYNG